jgi:hypothetical protein
LLAHDFEAQQVQAWVWEVSQVVVFEFFELREGPVAATELLSSQAHQELGVSFEFLFDQDRK